MLSQTLYTLAFAALTFLQLVSASPISNLPKFLGVSIYRINQQCLGPRGSTKPGIVYSPYTGTPGNSRCKTTQEMTSDIASISSQGKYGFIRLYNLDCSQVTVVLPLAQKCGMQVMLGIWDVQDMTTQVNLLSQYVGGNWDAVHSVMIGNEFILDGTCTASQMVSYTIDARTKLRAKGYTGPVATVNVFYQVMQDKSLCDSQDFIAVNCHPFFDGSVAAEDAGTWVENMRQQVSTACGGKYTLITGK